MAHIEYPQKTSEWGKVLIDGLNKILEKMESQMTSINDNTNIGYEPADHTVHPPPRTAEGGFIFFV